MRRGRPAKFDREQVLDAAEILFRRHGYAAPSVDALCAAASISKSTLYGSFGDKKALYLAIVERFRARVGRTVAGHLEGAAPLEDAIQSVFAAVADLYYAPEAAGCLVLGTTVAEAVADDDLRAVVADTLREMDGAFVLRLDAERRAGRLSATADPRHLSRMLAVLLQGLGVRARAGIPRHDALTLADDAITLLRAAGGR